MLECFNGQQQTIELSIVIRSLNPDFMIPFEHLAQLRPGFNRIRIPFEHVADIIDLNSQFSIELIPNDFQDGMTLYFGVIDFLQEVFMPEQSTKKVKCVVWDLDNTLWDGILVEDGPAKLKLKSISIQAVKELDRRGILNSIASKNNYDDAMRVLKDAHLDEYFLFPQISWGPKSDGVKAIAESLNISMDSILFIDDADFELQQVKAFCPEARILDAREVGRLLDLEETDVPITPEASARRKMYQIDANRKQLAQTFGNDYMGFLKQSNIRLNITPLSEENLERVHELTQRTNQMNFSGNRYDKDVLRTILATPYLDTYVLDCEDRFGKYGVVGFSIVDQREPRMTDLMFSCRVQSKRVEHEFLSFLIRKYLDRTGKLLIANYRKTERNAPSGRVFDDLGMQKIGESDGVLFLRLPTNQLPEYDGIVDISTDEKLALKTSS